ncbi:MAG TPA: phosphoribosyltransferase family protein [Anaerolineae bacterium]|nr:phosphoribosyltransferase family protein [Anaerolineae bacterium]HNT05518.1 phosphoribosyltransferase family protein [Anaerolineae bacterium]HQJ52443.1 phosphoribosyltransferase family protein [Anaerolineae bacterium]
MLFRDRSEAGKLLAARMDHLKGSHNLLVLGLPRGGVVVAYEVAVALGAPLDVYITRKIGAPYNPELAIGAVAGDGTVVLDHNLISRLQVPEDYLEAETERQKREIQRRLQAYRGRLEEPVVSDKTVVLVDDGVATGATVRATLKALRQQRPARLVLAVPVGPAETIRQLAQEADEVVCLYAPEMFWAVGAFYAEFDQTEDEQVVRLLQDRAALLKGSGRDAGASETPQNSAG